MSPPQVRVWLAPWVVIAAACSSPSPSDASAPSSSSPPSPTSPASGLAATSAQAQPPAVKGPKLGAAQAVALGGANLCVLEGGSVRCVGDWPVPFKTNGVRNQGFREPVTVAGLADVRSLIVDQHRGCAVSSAGAVSCWGNTTPTWSGWTGAAEGRLDAVPVPELADVESLALGYSGSCALDKAGKVTCFGPTFRPIRAPTKALLSPRVLAGSGVKQISGFGFGMCLLKVDGTVHCTGEAAPSKDGVESLTQVPGLKGATQIAAGDAHGCALHASGEVSCWGANERGQLGDGTQLERKGAVAVRDLRDAIAVASGHGFSCALTSGKRVLCWGDNGNCVAGDERRGCVKEKRMGTTGEVEIEACPLPQRITLPITPEKISLGSGTGCAIDATGKVACWGRSLTEAPGGCVGKLL